MKEIYKNMLKSDGAVQLKIFITVSNYTKYFYWLPLNDKQPQLNLTNIFLKNLVGEF